MNRMNKSVALTLMLAASLITALPADSQMAQTWNVQARAQAERGVSAGVTLLLKRQTATAISAFEKASQADPSDPTPFMMLGMALAMQGKYEPALHALQRAYSLQQTSETLNATGWVYFLQRDYDAAIASWNKALEMNPKLCQMHGNVGFALVRKGAFTDADAQFRKLVKCRPNSNYGYQGLAVIHYLRGNLRQARAAADRAQLTQSYAPVILLLAKVDALRGDKTSALKLAQQYNSLTRKSNATDRSMRDIGMPIQHDFMWDPLRVDSFDNGYLFSARLQDPLDDKKRASLARQGNAAGAVGAASKALAQTPNDLFLLRELGLAQMANGEYAAATETFKKVMEVSPGCKVDLLHTARALAMQGKGTEGAAYVQAFISQVPNQEISPAFLNIGKEPEKPVTPPVEAPAKEVKPKKKRNQLPEGVIPSAEF